MSELTLSYSLSDQSFENSKSLGILNLSCRFAEALAASGRFQRLTVLSNRSLASRMKLPPGTGTLDFDAASDGGFGRMVWDQWRCYSVARRTGNQWLFLPKGFSSFVRKPPVRLAAYVHDAMHDYYARRFPDVAKSFEHRYFSRSFLATLRHADVIFTNSEFTRSEVLRLAANLGIREPRICVAGIGFNPGVRLLDGVRANQVVVFLGRWPHKRSDLAVAWMQRWQTESKFAGEVHLVGELPEGVVLPVGPQWRHHRRLPEHELNALMGGARAVVYFSEYEGFGMPPVEGVLAGACPVFSNLPATREVMREAGFRFDNENYDSFRRAMDSALGVSLDTIEAWGRRLLVEHSWDNVVRRVIAGLQAVTSDSDRRV